MLLVLWHHSKQHSEKILSRLVRLAVDLCNRVHRKDEINEKYASPSQLFLDVM